MPGKIYDVNQEKAIEKKLKKQVNREKKAAARELRKDAEYIAMVKEQERREADEEKEKKRKEVLTFLENQQKTFKQMSSKKHATTSGKQPVNNIKT